MTPTEYRQEFIRTALHQRIYRHNEQWDDDERDTRCLGCGKAITVLQGGWSDRHNVCGFTCAERYNES